MCVFVNVCQNAGMHQISDGCNDETTAIINTYVDMLFSLTFEYLCLLQSLSNENTIMCYAQNINV